MRLSVVIPTYNRQASLSRCLASLQEQEDAPPFEVIAVDDGSDDDTAAVLKRYQSHLPLQTVRSPGNEGPGAARNRGVALSTGTHVLFIDDDVEAHPRLLASHAEAHAAGSANAVIGVMLAPEGTRLPSWSRWEQEQLEKQYSMMAAGRFEPTPRQFYTANASLARSHLESVAGFDPSFRRAEDVELAYRLRRLGLRFVFRPDAIVTHVPGRSLRAWWQLPLQYGAADVRMCRDKGEPWILKTVSREFQRRSRPVRGAVSRLSGGRRRSRAVAALAVGVGLGASAVRWFGPARSCYSLAYNILYYQGLSEELGSAAEFRAVLNGPQTVGAELGTP